MRTLIALSSLLLALPAWAEQRVTHRFQSSVPLAGIRRVVVDIPSGDITIRNGAANQLAVSGVVSREPDGPPSRDKEQRIVDHTSVAFVVRGGEAFVERTYGPDAQGWRAQSFSDYKVDLALPPGISIDVRTRTGDVSIDGSFGDIDVDLRAGEVVVRLPRAQVRELRASCRIGEVRTTIGNEIVEREGLFPGKTRYLNPDGKTFVNVHATFGEVSVELR